MVKDTKLALAKGAERGLLLERKRLLTPSGRTESEVPTSLGSTGVRDSESRISKNLINFFLEIMLSKP